MATPRGAQPREARLALTNVRIQRVAGSIYVYDERIVINTIAGDRTIPMASLARVATRKSWLGSRLLLALDSGEVIDVRKLGPSATTVAHRTIIDIARGKA